MTWFLNARALIDLPVDSNKRFRLSEGQGFCASFNGRDQQGRALIDLPVDSDECSDCPKVKASVHLPEDVISKVELYRGSK